MPLKRHEFVMFKIFPKRSKINKNASLGRKPRQGRSNEAPAPAYGKSTCERKGCPKARFSERPEAQNGFKHIELPSIGRHFCLHFVSGEGSEKQMKN